jgi:CheY-like chemotaxis protein
MAKILIIDDDEQMREMLRQLLTDAGYAVTTACDGVDGLKRFRADPADLVVTDIVMPNGEGIETIMLLRRVCVNLPIVAISGGQPQSALWLNVARHLGAECALAKPFTVAELMNAVAQAFTSRPNSVAQSHEGLPAAENEKESALA